MTAKKAMILAAGRGERLRPLTDTLPKPLIDVGGRRLIEHHLRALAEAGYHDVVINLAHLGQKIREHLEDGNRYGVRIRYSEEPEGALETAGGIAHALPLLGDEPFLVVNGDIRTDLAFDRLKIAGNAMMHLVLVDNPAHSPDGDFCLDNSSDPARLIHRSNHCQAYTFSGIGIYRPAAFDTVGTGRAALAPLIRKHIDRHEVTAEIHHGLWIDVGSHERLNHARRNEPEQPDG